MVTPSNDGVYVPRPCFFFGNPMSLLRALLSRFPTRAFRGENLGQRLDLEIVVLERRSLPERLAIGGPLS